MLLFFAVTLFLSALLLFLVQPMVGKMILPALGGTPAVWNTCMVFFQAALLAGYAYAHASVAWLGVRRQAAVQLVLMLTPVLVLPIAIDTASVPASEDNPVFWLLWRLLLGVGLPFFVVSANAPLLQKWFSQTRHPEAKDPYFLYAASNLGSLLALLSYPVIVEPSFTTPNQSWAWAGGYLLLIVMALGCAISMWRSRITVALESGGEVDGATSGCPEANDDSAALITAGRRLRWIALAFVPSSLMLGVTTHITADIAPVPLLWVLPLALYLLTFVFVFARTPLIPHALMVRVFPFAIVPTALMTIQGEASLGLLPVPIHLATFFVTAMVCHGALANDRPPPKHLTQFYLLMSIGGVLGGLFNAVVSPLVFDTVAEYPLVMVLACLVLVRREVIPTRASVRLLDLGLPILVGLVTVGFLHGFWKSGLWDVEQFNAVTIAVPAILCLLLMRRRLRFGLGLGATLVAIVLWFTVLSDETLYRGRNFYGTKKVTTDQDDHFHTFVHGSTVHGIQSTHPKGRHIPRTYFHPSGPVGDVFETYNLNPSRPQVAILGLGIGSMAGYARPGQHFTFYEIDPEVARIARDLRLFTCLEDCRASCEVVLGDGRLTVARAPDGHYGLMFLDAFSSDAVPTHLLTQEALQLYLSKLDERGILVFNISNRYLDLAPLLANLAKDAGLVCLRRNDPADTQKEREMAKHASEFVVMARHLRYIRKLDYDPGWEEVPTRPGLGVWTDQYTNIFRLLKWR